MGSREVRIAIAAAGVLLLGLGIFSHSWWTADLKGFGDLGVGLRSAKGCVMGQCSEQSFSRVNATGTFGMFKFAANVTYFGGILAMLGLVVGVGLREFTDNEQVAPLAGYLCGVVALSSVFALFTFPGGGGMVEMSMGWSFPATILGALTGAVAGRMGVGSGWDGGEYIPIGKPLGTPQPQPGMAPVPAPAPQPSSGAAQASLDYSQQMREAAAVPHAHDNLKKMKPRGVGATPNAAVDAVRSALRFVARSVEITPAGVTAILEGGGQRDLLWSEVGRVVARRLPPDPPYEKTLVVDLVPVSAPRRPIRLLPSTQANYAALPGGAALSSTDNLRGLGVMVDQHKPGVIEPHSEGFFREGKQAAMFQAMKQFADYDSQYS